VSRILGVLSVLLVCVTGPAVATETVAMINTVAPSVSGTPVYRGSLVADPGEWEPADATYTFQWLRDGTPISEAGASAYRPRLADLGARLSVRVTASRDGYRPTTATSAETGLVRRATLTLLERPRVSGIRRYLRRLTASTGVWAEYVPERSVRWLRDGEPIRGATARTYRLTHRDVGRRISVRVLAEKPGYLPRRVTSYATRRIGHRVPLRHTVYYHVETRGRIAASLAEFRRQAQETLNDPRGWRAAGIGFREVPSGGAMTLVLAEASQVPRFSPGCSAEWSCRAGRYVIINQMRWLGASASWWDHGGTLRGYRHMVVNHETGHWLGHGHRGCPARGALAPVMQQQSKGLGGCRHNPWPRADEWWTRV
jgi:hypothetical protein